MFTHTYEIVINLLDCENYSVSWFKEDFDALDDFFDDDIFTYSKCTYFRKNKNQL